MVGGCTSLDVLLCDTRRPGVRRSSPVRLGVLLGNHLLGTGLGERLVTVRSNKPVAGDKDDIDNFYSVKDGTSGNDIPDHVRLSFQTGKYHGGDITESEYDTGNAGKKLADFHKHEFSVLAGLLIWHVLVLRLYTSSSFRLFNAPLRSLLTNNGQTKSRHPL